MPGQRLASDGAGAAAPGGAPDTETWDRVVALLRAQRRVDLVCHVSPDGDALGSALAAGLGLRSLGVEARVCFGDDPQVVPASLGFLPGQDLVVPVREVPPRPGVMVAFDIASENRFGLLGAAARAAEQLVVLDHHASNTGFGTIRLVDPQAPATAFLVDELLRRLGVPLDADIATCLYTGVATDTGSFKYRATSPATHELAARLLATGIRQDLISRALWDTASFGYLKVLAAALGRAELDLAAACGNGLVWTVVPHEDRRRHRVAMDEIEGVIDAVRKASEADVALVVKESDAGELICSARSKGAVDVGRACVALGGGGHPSAAGFTGRGEVRALVRAFAGHLDAAVLG